MSNPSWLPSWRAAFPDFEEHYKKMVPRQWPKGLYREDSSAYKDQEVIGIFYSWIRKLTYWIENNLFPQNDDEDFLLEKWEDTFGLTKGSASLADRKNRIISSFRNRGTLTEARLKSIFAAVFGTSSSSDVTLSVVPPSQTWCATLGGKKITDRKIIAFENLNGCHGSAYNYVWFVGDGGKIYLWNGSSFTEKTSGTADDLYAVWAPAGNNNYAVAVGNNGTVLKWNGSSWATHSGSPGSFDYKRVWGVDENLYFALGNNDEVQKWDGSTWSVLSTGTGYTWNDLHCDKDYVWLCGENSYTGRIPTGGGSLSTWQLGFGGISMAGIRSCDEGVVAVGGYSDLHTFNGSTWDEWNVTPDQTITETFVDGWSFERLVSVGSYSGVQYIGYINQSGFRKIKLRGTSQVNCIWVDRQSCYCFFCGDDGFICIAPYNEEAFTNHQNALHIYSTNENLSPDYQISFDKCNLCQAVQQRFFCGQKKVLLASDTACGADVSVAG